MISINRHTILNRHCSRAQPLVFCIAVALTLTLLNSCGDSRWNVPESALEPYSSLQPLDVRNVILNLPENPKEAFETWSQSTGAFGPIYTEDILRIGAANRPETVEKLKAFTAHPDVMPIESAIDSTCGAASEIAVYGKRLSHGIDRFHFFLPNEVTPRVTWMNSGFNFAIYPTPTHLGVGLEWFLGSANPLVQTLPPSMFPQYMRDKMEPHRLPATALRGWLLVHFSERYYDSSQCINELLYWGKIMFLTHKCLPHESLSDLLDWSAEDLEWAETNEQSIWLELQPQDMLFNSNRMEFGRWFDEGPFTRIGGIPQEGPDRLGAWIGLRMVTDFMNANPELDMNELMEMRDPLPIIKSYRPA